MLATTADIIPGTNIQVLGLAKGNIVTSRNIGRDMMAGFKSMVGGEMTVGSERAARIQRG